MRARHCQLEANIATLAWASEKVALNGSGVVRRLLDDSSQSPQQGMRPVDVLASS